MARTKKAKDPRLVSIGEGLRKLRKERNFTSYYEAAHAMRFTPSQYWRYERGANITLSTLLAILDYHEISLQDFIEKYVRDFEN